MIASQQKYLEHQLAEKDFKLNSLLEITKAINNNLPVDQLIKIYTYVLKEQLGFPRFVLFLKNEKWEIFCKSGIKGKVKEKEANYYCFAACFDSPCSSRCCMGIHHDK